LVYDGLGQTSVKISLPLDRTVFQQSASNSATFQLAGQVQYYLAGSSNLTPEYQIESLDKNGMPIFVLQTWTTVGVSYSATLQQDENVWINLYDNQGRSLQIRDFEGKSGKNLIELDLQDYPSGAYFINLQYAQKWEIQKVMKVN
jgi:hypothetical protein